MKEFEFFSTDLNNIGEVAQKIFIETEKDNPASIYYNRVLERPNINWLQFLFQFIIPIIIFVSTLKHIFKKGAKAFTIAISCIAFCFYILLTLKDCLIWGVRFYQHYAPSSVRKKCRFEPSCSQYMILAIEKYGALKGLKMGLNRLSRCKIGNGGYDFP